MEHTVRGAACVALECRHSNASPVRVDLYASGPGRLEAGVDSLRWLFLRHGWDWHASMTEDHVELSVRGVDLAELEHLAHAQGLATSRAELRARIQDWDDALRSQHPGDD